MKEALYIDGIDLSPPPAGRLLPSAAFTSQAVFDAELARVFPKSWVHVADLVDLGHPGDFVAADIGTVPVVVVRSKDGQLRGFLNACRHRGAALVEGRGNCGRQLKCPYHAWSYATDGRLVGVPHREEFCADVKERSLIAVRVDTLGPMVFACLRADAPPLAEWAGDLSDTLKHASAAEMKLAFEFTYEVPVNWKVYVENGLDGYHIDFVHDVLASLVPNRKDARHVLQKWSSYTLAPMNTDVVKMMLPNLEPASDEPQTVRFGYVFPNLIPVVTLLDFSYLRIDPIGPESIRLVARSFDSGDVPEPLVEFRKQAFDRTNQQDIDVVKRVQKGLHAVGLPPGVYSDHLESRIGHFEQMLSRELSSGASTSAVEPSHTNGFGVRPG